MNSQNIDLQVVALPASQLASLFSPFAHHLVMAAMLAGETPGVVYTAASAAAPIGLAWFHGRVFLAGEPSAEAVQAVLAVMQAQLLPQTLTDGSDAFVLHCASPAWQAHVDQLLPGYSPIHAQRQYYACHALQQDWRPDLPPEMELLPADAALLARLNPHGRAALSEEMCSERTSVDDFLARSFGVCLVQGDELVGWCLSEYNQPGRCEVGVATMEPYQRRGLGTLMSLALVQQALGRGIHTIGWHCWQRNTASAALARRAGFSLVEEQMVYVYVLD